MGLTQHRRGIDNVRMLCNLLLMRGNIGRDGAGICPVRGHSNVQGQRTVGISEKPELVPLDRLAEQYGFEPPREKGLDTIGTVEGVLDGSVRAFIGMGGNFARAAPDTYRLEEAWKRLRLTVNVATKLNRGHLLCGEVSLLLPCLGRLERDVQATGDQKVSMEDSTTCIHASLGTHEPASPDLLSEPAIVAGMAKAILGDASRAPWDDWVADYSLVRDAIEATYPVDFAEFNDRLHTPGGFPRKIAARERRWETDSGRAEFMVPETLCAPGFDDAQGRYRLVTVRSNDQFNTTIYGYRDRFRGIDGTRRVLMMSPEDIEQSGLEDGDPVDVLTDAAVEEGGETVERAVGGLRVVARNLPRGCIVGYSPSSTRCCPSATTPSRRGCRRANRSRCGCGRQRATGRRRCRRARLPSEPGGVYFFASTPSASRSMKVWVTSGRLSSTHCAMASSWARICSHTRCVSASPACFAAAMSAV